MTERLRRRDDARLEQVLLDDPFVPIRRRERHDLRLRVPRVRVPREAHPAQE
jgi:hypothetical protein